MYNFFINSFVEGYLGGFHILAIVSSASKNMLQISLWDIDFISFGYITRSGISGSYCSTIFNFLSKLYTVFDSGYTTLLPFQQDWRNLFSPYPLQHLLISFLLRIPTFTVVRWYLIVVLICIYLMISHAEHLFMHLLVICISSLEKTFY